MYGLDFKFIFWPVGAVNPHLHCEYLKITNVLSLNVNI